eukprot:TRINITY_DN4100_c0_g2_i1.p1 TRINITY_DN4100_c0_g2~~TRINITY_DN4100_c0_g2_i1.p1  ORF type:complete len:459 (-),score=30.27 TRINITY_DN4100_c0_g2_i1:54-1430(-)
MSDNWIPTDILNVIGAYLPPTERGRLLVSTAQFYSTVRTKQSFWDALWKECCFYICPSSSKEPKGSIASIRADLANSFSAIRRLADPLSISSLQCTLVSGVPNWLPVEGYRSYDAQVALLSKQETFYSYSYEDWHQGSWSDRTQIEAVCVDTTRLRSDGIESLQFATRPPKMTETTLPLGGGFFCFDRSHVYAYTDTDEYTIFRMSPDGSSTLEPFRKLPRDIFPPRPFEWRVASTAQPRFHTFGERPVYARATCLEKVLEDGQRSKTFFISVHDILANENTLDSVQLEVPAVLDEALLIPQVQYPSQAFYPQISDSHFIIVLSNPSKTSPKSFILIWDISVRLPSKGGSLFPKYVIIADLLLNNRCAGYEGGFVVVGSGLDDPTKVFDLRDAPTFSGEALRVEPFDVPTYGADIKTAACGRLIAQTGWKTKGLGIFDLVERKLLCRLPSCTDVRFID